MSGDLENLRIMEVLLTAEIFNQNPTLDLNDLTPACREMFCSGDTKSIKRPVYVSDGLIKRTLDIVDAHEKMTKNPFVSYEDFGQRMKSQPSSRPRNGSLRREVNHSSGRTRPLHFSLNLLTAQEFHTMMHGRQTRATKIPRRASMQKSPS